MNKKNGDRIIITPELLVKMFGRLDPIVFAAAIGPMLMDDPIKAYDDLIENFKQAEDGPGKEGAIEATVEMKNAYLKMSVFERDRIKRELSLHYAKFLQKEFKKFVTKKRKKKS